MAPEARRRGVARELLARVAADARDLGASTCSLEVRAGNLGAQAIHSQLNELHAAIRARDDAAAQSALQPLAERFPRLIESLQAALCSA